MRKKVIKELKKRQKHAPTNEPNTQEAILAQHIYDELYGLVSNPKFRARNTQEVIMLVDHIFEELFFGLQYCATSLLTSKSSGEMYSRIVQIGKESLTTLFVEEVPYTLLFELIRLRMNIVMIGNWLDQKVISKGDNREQWKKEYKDCIKLYRNAYDYLCEELGLERKVSGKDDFTVLKNIIKHGDLVNPSKGNREQDLEEIRKKYSFMTDEKSARRNEIKAMLNRDSVDHMPYPRGLFEDPPIGYSRGRTVPSSQNDALSMILQKLEKIEETQEAFDGALGKLAYTVGNGASFGAYFSDADDEGGYGDYPEFDMDEDDPEDEDDLAMLYDEDFLKKMHSDDYSIEGYGSPNDESIATSIGQIARELGEQEDEERQNKLGRMWENAKAIKPEEITEVPKLSRKVILPDNEEDIDVNIVDKFNASSAAAFTQTASEVEPEFIPENDSGTENLEDPE